MAERIRKSGTFTASDVHIDTGLTEISVAYKLAADMYIADKVFPNVGVKKQSDKIFKFDKNDWLRNEAVRRAPGTESAGGGFAITSSDTYHADVWSYHKDIPRETLANSDLEGLEAQVAEFVTQKLLVAREVEWAANFFTTSIWADQGDPDDATGDATNTTWPYFIYFDDQANSDPLGEVTYATELLIKTTGYKPNTLVVGLRTHNMFRLHADIKEQVKYTQSQLVTVPQLSQFFGVDKYVIGQMPYADNIEAGTANYEFAFDDAMLLVYAPPRPGVLIPSGGYIFEWTGLNDLGYNVSMDSWWEQKTKSQRVEGEMAYDAKLLCRDMGIFFTDCLST